MVSKRFSPFLLFPIPIPGARYDDVNEQEGKSIFFQKHANILKEDKPLLDGRILVKAITEIKIQDQIVGALHHHKLDLNVVHLASL